MLLKVKMKKVLILTAERTGTGHKASANAIENKLLQMGGFECRQLNCFSLMGKMGENMENSYIPLTTKHPYIWKIAHTFSQWFSGLVHWFMRIKSQKKMLKEINEFKPDLIISVHCMFTKAVSKMLKKNNLNIPFMVNVIDLVNPPKVWRDKRADMVFLPTVEAKNQYLKLGFDENKLIVSGFPIREDIVVLNEPKKIGENVNILMVNPSVNLKKNIKFVLEACKIKNSSIKIVCGRDERLYNTLIKLQQENESLKKVEILGFVKNMHELLAWCHILFTKAGPNMLLEGTRSGSAVVVTGHIPGQEAKNYEYITKNGYGIKCENPNKIFDAVSTLINSGEIDNCFKNVLNAECNDGAKIIATEIEKFLEKENKK